MTRRHTLLAAACTTVALAVAAPAGAVTPVASWQMNETTGPMIDSAGTFNGTVGSDVVRTGAVYTFPYVQPSAGIYAPNHIVTVPANNTLNPGTGPYTVTIRLKFANHFGNITQKGQGGSHYWKMEAPKGIIKCLFRGADGSKSVNSGVALSDGLWHTVACSRSGTSVTMTIDGGAIIRRGTGPTGDISNTAPLSVGGKSHCDGTTITCDYWVGSIDYLTISKG